VASFSEKSSVNLTIIFHAFIWIVVMAIGYPSGILVFWPIAFAVLIFSMYRFYSIVFRNLSYNRKTIWAIFAFSIMWSIIFSNMFYRQFYIAGRPESLFGTTPILVPLYFSVMALVATVFLIVAMRTALITKILLVFGLVIISLFSTSIT
jgi:hypothetical protein